MIQDNVTAFVRTIAEKCRVCYTCVRECPAKAIRIREGQAEIIAERCICCGNCVKVCSQNAKQIVSTVDAVEEILSSQCKIAAILAPSFPAEFEDIEYGYLVGMLRDMGFDYVNEVAFGADLVAAQYRKLLQENKDKHYIATTCPALVDYVERYMPELVDYLAPIVSPMVAEARVLRAIHGQDVKVVFIGPCIAKKKEVRSEFIEGDVDDSLTFGELREMFARRGMVEGTVKWSEFDGPRPGLGALFPISRGMLQAARIREDILEGNVVAADGRTNFTAALKEFALGTLDTGLLEVLCCNGCIMGPGMTAKSPEYKRRSDVQKYVRTELNRGNEEQWHANMTGMKPLDLSRTYGKNDQRIMVSDDSRLTEIMHKMGKYKPEDELNCGACGYDTCREHAVAILKGLAESEMCLPYTISKLKDAYSELEISHSSLMLAQEALMQAEKLASMGQIAAGIAHEVNNPLGVVLLYSHLLLDEVRDENARKDLSVIAENADRCKKIVAGLLNFARQTKTIVERTDLFALIKSNVEAMPLPENIKVKYECKTDDKFADIDRDQVVQVLSNLVSNAAAAMPDGGEISITVDGNEQDIVFLVRDSGCGIPQENLGKIFEPFFTTKQIGKGTGLGLAVTYGIVKMHKGDITVKSNTDTVKGPTGTVFTVKLPRHSRGDEN